MAIGRIDRKPKFPPIYKKPAPPPPPPEQDKSFSPLQRPVKSPTDQLVGPGAKALGQVVAGPAAIAEAPPADDDFGFAPPTAVAATLAIGTQGPEVADMQQRLINAGFDPGPVDGIFGPLTEAGVKSFQEAAGLPADGVATPELFAVLDQLENPTPEVPAEVPTEASTTVPADPTGTVPTDVPPTAEQPAFGSPEVQSALSRLPDPAQDPEVFLFAVQRATADFQNAISNAETPPDPQVVSQDLQALATAFSAAGEAGGAQARVLATLAQLALNPDVPPTFQQELLRSFTNDGGNVGNIEKAMQAARNVQPAELNSALFQTIAAAIPAAVAASPDGAKEALEARGQLAAVLADPNVSQEVRKRLGQGFNGDDDAGDIRNALRTAESKEDLTAVLAFQLANPGAVEGLTEIAPGQLAQAVQFLATNFEDLEENNVVEGLRNGLVELMRGDKGKALEDFLKTGEDSLNSQEDLLKQFAELIDLNGLVGQEIF